jgi:hypothetical protein
VKQDAELIQDLLEKEGIACRPYRVAEVREERGDYPYAGDAAGGSSWLPLHPGPVWMAHRVGKPVQGQRPPIRLLLQRRHPDVGSLSHSAA